MDVPAAERHRFCITDEDVVELARYAVAIERHYGRPMDIEWGKDGADGKLYVLQARPETVKSQPARERAGALPPEGQRSRVLVSGRAIGQKIGSGPVRVVQDAAEMSRVREGDVLVTDMTDPNWEPVMKRAAAIVTNRGGRTCHAAIIARELGIPAVVGCGDATDRLADGGAGHRVLRRGRHRQRLRGPAAVRGRRLSDSARCRSIPVKIAMNVGNPRARVRLPEPAERRRGPRAPRVHHQQHDRRASEGGARLSGPAARPAARGRVARRAAMPSPRAFYVEKLVEGVATIAAAFWPKPVIVRLSDFKSNEYRKLHRRRALRAGGGEPDARLPRRVALHRAESFRDCFELECAALKRVRDEMGLTNVELMVPFVRTVDEARRSMDAPRAERPASAARTACASS